MHNPYKNGINNICVKDSLFRILEASTWENFLILFWIPRCKERLIKSPSFISSAWCSETRIVQHESGEEIEGALLLINLFRNEEIFSNNIFNLLIFVLFIALCSKGRLEKVSRL